MNLRESMSYQANVSLSITKHLFSKHEFQDKNTVFSTLSLQVVLSIMALRVPHNINKYSATYLESLTKMRDSPIDYNFYVFKIFHKSFVEVNEGIKAFGCCLHDITPPQINLIVDALSFLFYIRDNFSKTITQSSCWVIANDSY